MLHLIHFLTTNYVLFPDVLRLPYYVIFNMHSFLRQQIMFFKYVKIIIILTK